MVSEGISVWQTRDGKTTGTSKTQNYDMGGTMEVVGIDGQDLVLNWVVTYSGSRYPGSSTLRFNPTCSSYTGTTRSSSSTGKTWRSRIGAPQVNR